MTKQIIRSRAEAVKEIGQRINNPGVIEWADEVTAMADNRKMSAEAIVKTEAFRVITRIFCR